MDRAEFEQHLGSLKAEMARSLTVPQDAVTIGLAETQVAGETRLRVEVATTDVRPLEGPMAQLAGRELGRWTVRSVVSLEVGYEARQ